MPVFAAHIEPYMSCGWGNWYGYQNAILHCYKMRKASPAAAKADSRRSSQP